MTGETPHTPQRHLQPQSAGTRVGGFPNPPKGSATLSVQCLCVLGLQLAVSTPIHQTCSESLACIWANPTLTAINALALRKTAEDAALQVWLYFSLHRVSYLGLVFSIGLKLCSHHLG